MWQFPIHFARISHLLFSPSQVDQESHTIISFRFDTLIHWVGCEGMFLLRISGGFSLEMEGSWF